MNHSVDINTIGSEYNITDEYGRFLTTLQVMTLDEVLEAAIGPYSEDIGTYDEYLVQTIEVLSGFEGVDDYTTMWSATYDELVDLTDLIEDALNNGYNRIIVEHLDMVDDLV